MPGWDRRSLGNGGDGVRISDNAQDNQIGGVGDGEANTIAFNAGNGVTVLGDLSTGNIIRGNSIRDNTGLGIDLGDDGVTPNHSGGPITGPNGLTNFPRSSRPGQGRPRTLWALILVLPTLSSRSICTPPPPPILRVTARARGILGFVVVVTDDAGNADFTVDLDAVEPGRVHHRNRH